MKKKILLFFGSVAQDDSLACKTVCVLGARGDLPTPDQMIDNFSLFSFGSDRCIFKDR